MGWPRTPKQAAHVLVVATVLVLGAVTVAGNVGPLVTELGTAPAAIVLVSTRPSPWETEGTDCLSSPPIICAAPELRDQGSLAGTRQLTRVL